MNLFKDIFPTFSPPVLRKVNLKDYFTTNKSSSWEKLVSVEAWVTLDSLLTLEYIPVNLVTLWPKEHAVIKIQFISAQKRPAPSPHTACATQKSKGRSEVTESQGREEETSQQLNKCVMKARGWYLRADGTSKRGGDRAEQWGRVSKDKIHWHASLKMPPRRAGEMARRWIALFALQRTQGLFPPHTQWLTTGYPSSPGGSVPLASATHIVHRYTCRQNT